MRFLLILMISLFVQIFSFAQIDNREMQKEMEKMRKEMQEQLKNFNFDNLQIDTLMLKNFTFPEGFNSENFIMPNDINMNEMLKMMERQMSQMDMEGMLKMMEKNMAKMDFSEMEKIIEPFMNGEFFMFPNPENLQKEGEDEEKGATPKNKKKSKIRKTYKM